MFKKRVEFWVCFALAFALVFVGANLAHAATVQQTDKGTIANPYRNTEYLNFLDAAAKVLTIPFSGTMTAIQIYGNVADNGHGGSPDVYIVLKEYANCAGAGTNVAANYTGVPGTFGADKYWNLTGLSVGLNSTSCYQLTATGSSGGYGAAFYPWGSATDIWTYGKLDLLPNDIQDFYFILSGSSYSEPDAIAITFPSSTSTPIQEFTDWVVSFSQATSTTASSADFYIKQIYVGATSTALTTLAGNSSYPPTIAPSPETIYKPFALGLGTWYAQAQMRYFRDIYDQYGSLVATSSVISFPIGWGFGASGSWAMPTSTATSSEWTMTCDPDSGLFSYSLCFLAQALFVPSSGATAQFQGIGDLVSSKPPLGYFQQIKTALSGLTETTSTFALADLSSMSTTLTTPIKTAIQIILWFLFGFWILNRIRHFEL